MQKYATAHLQIDYYVKKQISIESDLTSFY